ncbi:MAG: PaaD-like protein (DUF59) involved in Fe-S cluster assembly, partial [uncultured Nocardioidaceae bacterium]
ERADAANRRGCSQRRGPRGSARGRPECEPDSGRGGRDRGHARRRRPRARHQRRRPRSGLRRAGGRVQSCGDRHDAHLGGVPADRRHRGPDQAGAGGPGRGLPRQLGLDAAVGAGQDHRRRTRAAASARLQPL